MQEGAEAGSAGLKNTAQDFALGLHVHAQVFEFAVLLGACGDVRDPHQPDARFARKIDGVEFEGVVGRLEGGVGIGQPHFHVLQGIRFLGIDARSGRLEQPRHVVARRTQDLGGDDGPDQFLEAHVGEVFAAKQSRQRFRHLRQDLVLAVEQEDSLRRALENGLGQPVAGAE